MTKSFVLLQLYGILKTTLRGHQGRVSALSISRDKKLLATVGEDKKLLLWKLDIRGDLDKLLDRGCSWLGEYLESTNHPQEGGDKTSGEESPETTVDTLDSSVIHFYAKTTRSGPTIFDIVFG